MKVLTIVGTRPEIIRLSETIKKIDKYLDQVIVHTGQNYDYELNEVFFKDLNLRKPDYFLNAAGTNGAETIGKVIIEVDKVLAKECPDAVLVLGDTNSCMAVISAKRRKIPTFHMEAGNRCFDMRVPEEINRRIVDHTADINLTYSSIAREYLLREGLPPDLVIKVGSPMAEVLRKNENSIHESNILEKLGVKEYEFFVVSAHREENIDSDKNFGRLITVLNVIANNYQLPIVVSTHPRTKKRITEKGVNLNEKIKLLKPLGFSDYNKLQLSAKAVISDSGTISEESSILNFPALNIREAHERPEAFEEAVVMMVGLDETTVLNSLEILGGQSRGEERSFKIVDDYDVENVSDKIVRILVSYTDYVRRVVWKKY